MQIAPLDILIIVVYFVVIGGVGYYASRGEKSAEKFFLAGRNIPMWAVAFTLMATIIGTGTFVGHPGTAYQKGLILLIPHMTVPFVLLFVARVVVPFYRRVVRMSAYEYIGQRFGLGGRFYTSFGFLADRIFDLGVTLLTTALAVNVLTGWDLRSVILGVGIFTIAYTMIGGVAAVVWTDVVQGIVLMVGGLFVVLRLMFAPEAGEWFGVVGETYRAGKLTLGLSGFTWDSLFSTENNTTYLFILAYAVQWTRRYATDQHIVQRYLVAKTDEGASRAAFLGAVLCLPVFAMFMFAGACLNGFFALSHLPPPQVADAALPYFLANYMPMGLLGLVIAAVLAAAMSTVSADLSSVATVLTKDYYLHFKAGASERAQLLCGRLMVAGGGILTIVAAWLLLPEEGAAPLMERVIIIASILSGGTLGLFCLGFFTRTATRQGCYIGLAAAALFTAWALLTQPGGRVVDLGWNFPLNPLLIGVCGHLVLFGTGWIASWLLGGYVPPDVDRLTYRSLKQIAADEAADRARTKQPNVLLVIVDDMGVHQLGCYGSSFCETPAIDRLAAGGVRFGCAYSASPICSPARAALYTGLHPARLHLTNYIPGTEPPNGRLHTPPWRPFLPVEIDTVGDLLQRAGYATGHFGKWHLAPDYKYRPGRPMDPESQGFDTVFFTRKPTEDADPEADPHHIDRITDRAIEFMSRPRDNPFLCVVAHNALHRPELAPARLVARFAAKPGAEREANRPVIAAMAHLVDASVGRLLAHLDATGRRENTMVVFTSDHGAFGRSAERKPLRGAKADLYEGGIRVPLVLSQPGVLPPGERQGAVFGTDLLPTLLEHCGVPPVATSDGASFRAALLDPAAPLPDHGELCWHFPHYHHLGLAPCGAIRAGRWKLVEWFEGTIGGATDAPALELFDLESDPREENNLAPAQPERAADLLARLRAWRRRVGAQEMTVNPGFDPTRGTHDVPPPPGDPGNPFRS